MCGDKAIKIKSLERYSYTSTTSRSLRTLEGPERRTCQKIRIEHQTECGKSHQIYRQMRKKMSLQRQSSGKITKCLKIKKS